MQRMRGRVGLTVLTVAVAIVAGACSSDPETRNDTQAHTGNDATDVEAASSLDGVYRVTITKQDAIAGGFGDDPDFPTTQTLYLDGGSWRMRGEEGGNGGTYSVDGDEISIESPDTDVVNTFTFTRDDEGNLTFVAVLPMDPGDASYWATNPWTKIR